MITSKDTLLEYVKDNYEREITKAEKRLLLKIKEAVKSTNDKRVLLDGPCQAYARIEEGKDTYVFTMLYIRNGHMRAVLRPYERRYAGFMPPRFKVYDFDKDIEIRSVEISDVKALALKVAHALEIPEEIKQYIDNLPQKAPGSDDITLVRFLGVETNNDYTTNYMFEAADSKDPVNVPEYQFRENIFPKSYFAILFKAFSKKTKGKPGERRIRIVETTSYGKAHEIADNACANRTLCKDDDETVIWSSITPISEEEAKKYDKKDYIQ